MGIRNFLGEFYRGLFILIGVLGATLIPYANNYDITSLELLGVGLVTFIISCIGITFAHWTQGIKEFSEET